MNWQQLNCLTEKNKTIYREYFLDFSETPSFFSLAYDPEGHDCVTRDLKSCADRGGVMVLVKWAGQERGEMTQYNCWGIGLIMVANGSRENYMKLY